MVTHVTTVRRRMALAGASVALLGVAGVVTATAANSGSTAHPAQHSHSYADYLDDQSGGDPCALPPDQRTGGWVCPAVDGRK